MKTIAISLVAGLLCLPAAAFEQALPPGADAILGGWEGTSICVKADWNAACNDEVIRYDFAPAAGKPGTVVLQAQKLVGGRMQPMYGDYALAYDPAAREWAGEFSNARVHIRWSYTVDGDRLTGKVVMLPDGRVGRHVEARRVRP